MATAKNRSMKDVFHCCVFTRLYPEIDELVSECEPPMALTLNLELSNEVVTLPLKVGGSQLSRVQRIKKGRVLRP